MFDSLSLQDLPWLIWSFPGKFTRILRMCKEARACYDWRLPLPLAPPPAIPQAALHLCRRFVFIMGTSIALSLNAALQRGSRRSGILGKALWRSVQLFLLGVLVINPNYCQGPRKWPCVVLHHPHYANFILVAPPPT